MTGTPLAGLIDLVAEELGGRALLANDEFFAPKENLLKPGRGVADPDRYTSHGWWMDGWETRRRRTPGHDWCIIRLGARGVIRAVTVDTNHFKGNHPEACSLDGAIVMRTVAPAKLAASRTVWAPLLPRTPLQGHSENQLAIGSETLVTHIRLNIYPDGGVARLRVWGEARPDWRKLARGQGPIDLVAARHGGAPLQSSDEFFGRPDRLLMPGRPANMGDGWQTRRRRGPGHDWVILRLGTRGTIGAVEVDTTHFKGNYPESFSLEACDAPATGPQDVPPATAPWTELMPRTPLRAHRRHRFTVARSLQAVTHVRFNMFPDGGVARLRLLGRPAAASA